MQNQDRKCHQKYSISGYHSVQRKMRKEQSTEVMKFNSSQLIQPIKMEIAALKWKWFEGSLD